MREVMAFLNVPIALLEPTTAALEVVLLSVQPVLRVSPVQLVPPNANHAEMERTPQPEVPAHRARSASRGPLLPDLHVLHALLVLTKLLPVRSHALYARLERTKRQLEFLNVRTVPLEVTETPRTGLPQSAQHVRLGQLVLLVRHNVLHAQQEILCLRTFAALVRLDTTKEVPAQRAAIPVRRVPLVCRWD